MLKEHMERDDAEEPRLISSLHMNQYVNILKDMFPTISKQPQPAGEAKAASAAKQTTKTSTSNSTSLGGDLIREIVDKVKLELQQELKEYKSEIRKKQQENMVLRVNKSRKLSLRKPTRRSNESSWRLNSS